MIIFTFDLETGVARAATSAIIKAGAGVVVPVRVTFSEAPGTVAGLALRLGQDTAPPTLLAAAGAFTAENETLYTASLDAGATALVNFMATKGPTQVLAQFSGTIDGVLRVSPNFSVTVQPLIPAAA